MKMGACIAALVLTSGCHFDDDASLGLSQSSGADGGQVDSAVALPDAAYVERRHLLLSEIKPTVSSEEFIELFNPTAETIDLSDYFLADNAGYANLAGAFGEGPRPTVHFSDFIARFPGGASIAPGEVKVIAMDSDGFEERFETEPDYALDGVGAAAMREVYSNSIGSQASLTDSGEGVALFFWDGDTDLVVDVDLMVAGAATSAANQLQDKSGLAVDGPDTGAAATKYFSEAASIDDMPLQAEDEQTYQRIALEGGREDRDATGNGLHGHDESSERIAETWTVADAPTPGTVPNLAE
jgi:hypothetical protein